MSSETAPSRSAILDAHRFRRACAQFATGVAIVTVIDAEGEPHGMTVNSFTSVSLSPPLILVCIDTRAGIYQMFRPGAIMAINVLREEQRATSVLFARPGASRLYLPDWVAGETGAPLLPGCLAAFEAQVDRIIEAGDHLIVLAAVRAVTASSGLPLLYFDSNYQTLASES